MMRTSAMSGTLVIRHSPSAMIAAAISLSTEFFAPLARTVPASLAPPSTTYLSKEFTFQRS